MGITSILIKLCEQAMLVPQSKSEAKTQIPNQPFLKIYA